MSAYKNECMHADAGSLVALPRLVVHAMDIALDKDPRFLRNNLALTACIYLYIYSKVLVIYSMAVSVQSIFH